MNNLKSLNYKIENKINEDLILLESLNKTILANRKYIIKMPAEGEAVVVCLSGGLDSVVNIAILMKEYNLKVFPFFINRGQSNYKYEKESADFFNQYFKSNFPNNYNDYMEIEVMTPGVQYKDLLRDAKKMVDDIPFRHNVSYPARNPIIFLTGMEYAYSLMSKGIIIKNIFASYVASDSSFHCGLTNTRLMNILMCQIMHDWDWQFISLPTELELGNYFDKDVLIKWGYENHIPIHKTRTCVKKLDIECGDCPTCWDRRRSFKEAGVPDATVYKYKMSSEYPTYYDHENEEKLKMI